jgi:hypothetical protein
MCAASSTECRPRLASEPKPASGLASQARAGGAAGLLLVRASFATDRMIRRRSIRMICAGPPVSRRVLHNRSLTVVTVVTVLTGRDCRRGHRLRQVGARDGEALASPPGSATAACPRPGSCASGDDRSSCRGRRESPAHQEGITVSSSFVGQLLVVRRFLRGDDRAGRPFHGGGRAALRQGGAHRPGRVVALGEPSHLAEQAATATRVRLRAPGQPMLQRGGRRRTSSSSSPSASISASTP